MPYKLATLIPQTIVYESVSGHYSLDDISGVVGEIVKFLDSCPEKGGIILANLSQLKSIDTNLLEVRKKTEIFFRHPNYHITAAYGSTDKVVVGFVVNSLAGLFKQPIKLFTTEAEALNYIIMAKPELAQSLPEALKQAQNTAKH